MVEPRRTQRLAEELSYYSAAARGMNLVEPARLWCRIVEGREYGREICFVERFRSARVYRVGGSLISGNFPQECLCDLRLVRF